MIALADFNPLKEIQMTQDFEHFDPEHMEEINFKDITPLPNQFVYKIECEKAEIEETKGDARNLFKMDALKSIDEIYEMIKPTQVERFLEETKNNFSFVMVEPKRSIPQRNMFSSVFEMKVGHGYRTFLRQTFTLRSDKNGIFTHTGGVYTALPDLPRANVSTYQVHGPDAVYFNHEYLRNFRTFLSGRELEILKLISMGYNTSKISEGLFISRHTVETHRKNMIRKLEVNNTPHLVAVSKDIGLI